MKCRSVFLFFSALLLVFATAGTVFSAQLEKDAQSHFRQARVTAQRAVAKLNDGTSVVVEMEKLRGLADSLQVDYLLLQEKFNSRSERVAEFSAAIQQRQLTMETHLEQAVAELLSIITALSSTANPTPPDFQAIINLVTATLPEINHPLLGSLPYQSSRLSPTYPEILPLLTPAYQGGGAVVAAVDTQESPFAQITPEISALAESLAWNPIKIYAWVINNIEAEWYWGSMKGAAETLRQKSGNDADQAALLVALMRAANFPARYVRGVIEFVPGIERLQNLVGLDDPLEVVRYLQQAGIPSEPVISGGRVSNLRFEHVWVEVYLPYSNYRGAVLDEQGKIWLPLDTHIKPEGYFVSSPATEIPADLVRGVPDDYLQKSRIETPLEYLRNRVETETAAIWNETLTTHKLRPTSVEVLPASLQFKTLAVTAESSSLPAELIQTVTFRGGADDGRELFRLTLPTAEVSNRQVVVSYEPETLADQLLIDAHGGLSSTPAYLVRLRPVLLIDGARKIIAKEGLAMGDDYQLTVQFKGPAGSAAQTARHIVGNPAALGIVAQQAIQPPVLPEEEQDAAWLLWGTAQDYIARWNLAEDELAAFFNLRMSRPLPTLVTVGGVLKVSHLLDMPQEMTWQGLFMDAGLRRIELAAQKGDHQRIVEFMRLSALQGSVLEQRVFEDRFEVAAVSTAKVLALANESGNPLLVLDGSNIVELLPTLGLPEYIRADIETAIHQGLSVSLPAQETVVQQWSGYGYLKQDSATGEAGYMLSGTIAGGMTIAIWAESYRKNVLQAPFADPPNIDVLAAVHIAKIAVNDRQSGLVGQQLEKPLAVLVTDIKGRPVVGAKVTFTHVAGLVKQADNSPLVTYEEATDTQGIARFQPVLGKYTDTNPSFQRVNQTDTHATQVGINLFDASVKSRYGDLSLTQPFEVYGCPDTATKLQKFLGEGNSSLVNNPAGSLLLKVFDQYENPVSNVPVTFEALAAAPTTVGDSLPTNYRNIEFYLPKTCTTAYPLWSDCSASSSSSLSLESAVHGVMVNTLLGNSLATKYTVKASTPGVPEIYFTLFSRGWKSAGDYYPPHLYVSYLAKVNETGQRIDAVRVNKDLEKPLLASMVLVYSDYSVGEKRACTTENAQGDPITYDCWDLEVSDLIQTRKITNGKVTFATQSGGKLSATEITADGLYQSKYIAGEVPALNLIDISGEAQVTLPEILGTVSDDIYFTADVRGLKSPVIPERSVTLKSGQIGLFDRETKALIPVQNQQKETFSVYGVDVPTQINPEIIMLGDSGMARQNVTIDYTIEPQGEGTAGYAAQSAQLDLFTGVCDDLVSDKWVGYLIGDAHQGAGQAVYSRGSVFDPKQQYCVQSVLNRGSSAEIRGDKVKLQTLYADLDIDSDNNAGWLADGTHNLPSRNPLEDQVEDLDGLPGKVIKPNFLDVDGDKVPGFADGINLNGQAGDGASASFVPMLLEIDTRLDTSKIKLKFNYSASDPAQVKRTGNETDGYNYQAAPGHLRIWTKDGGLSRKVTSVMNGGNYVSPDETYSLSDLGWSRGSVLKLYVEGIAPSATSGAQQIKLTIDPDGTAATTLTGDVVNSIVLLAALVPDYDHNRVIDEKDRQRAARGDTYYFWINDDDDRPLEEARNKASDIPGSTMKWYQENAAGDFGLFSDEIHNYGNGIIDGVRDLIDFFPVQLDIEELLTLFPTERYTYRLVSGGEHLNFAYTGLPAASAGDYLVGTPSGNAFDLSVVRKQSYANTFPVAAGGTNLFGGTNGDTFLTQLQTEKKGVILFEGLSALNGTLRLEITDGTDVLFSFSLNLQLSGVENMFRHLNLIQDLALYGAPDLEDVGTGESTAKGGEKSRPGEPVGYPDREADGENNSDPRYIAWIHGFNVNGQQVRAWHSEMFKRFYWSGSRARFVGVSWYGFKGQDPVLDSSVDYHSNVEHAFATAAIFGPRLKLIVGDRPVTLVAHSLGNMLVSSYLNDFHATLLPEKKPNVDKYIMLNAAVPLEAYLGDPQDPNAQYSPANSMVHSIWYGYQQRLGSSEWYKLFDDNNATTVTDNRETLTWRSRFANFPLSITSHSFYSTGEDVLATYAGEGPSWNQLKSGDFGRNSWVIQEKWKGRAPVGGDGFGGTTVMGWGFNPSDYYPYIPLDSDTKIWLDKKKSSANTDINISELIEKPFFRVPSSLNGLSTLFDPNIGGPGSDFAADHRSWLLAKAFPALTLPTGGHDGARMGFRLSNDNILNMNDTKNGWPVERVNANTTDWRHSDIKDVAFPFTYKVVEELLQRGGLK